MSPRLKKPDPINKIPRSKDPPGTPKPDPTPHDPAILGTAEQRAAQEGETPEPVVNIGAPDVLGTGPQRAAQEEHNASERMLADLPRGNRIQVAHQTEQIEADKATARAEHATRAAPRLPSRPDAPTFAPKPHLPGAVVYYVMPDGTDREAIILSVHDEGVNLLVRVATHPDDPVQRVQYALVPEGKAGEPGTWREVSA